MKKITLTLICTVIAQFSFGQTINWSYDIGFQIKPQSPAVADDGTIYIGSEDNTNFHAINPDGTLKWVYNQLADNVYSSASIGSDGTIYVGSKDDYLHAINPDGTQKWKALVGAGANVIYSTPAIANDGTVYIGSDDDNFYAINSDGTQKWTFAGGGNFRGTPAIAADATVYVTCDDDNLYAINPDGTQKWAFNVGGNAQSGLAIQSDGTIIVGVDQGGTTGAVFAVNPDGTQKWSKTVIGRISVCAPALAADGTIYVGTKEGYNMLALNPADGSQVWEYVVDAVSITNSSPAVGDDGKIYFGSWDDHLYCINPDGTFNFKVNLNDDVWSSPAIHNGTLYIGSYDGKLHSIDIPSTGLAASDWPMFGKNLQHTSSLDATLGTEDVALKNGFKLFYEDNALNIISTEFNGNAEAIVYNALGMKINEQKLDFSKNKLEKISLQESAGLYFVKIIGTEDRFSITKKVVLNN